MVQKAMRQYFQDKLENKIQYTKTLRFIKSSFYVKKLEKEEQTKPKASREKEINICGNK